MKILIGPIATFMLVLGLVVPAQAATVATPSLSAASGTYIERVPVTISTATASSTIRYTTNGTTPTASSTLYRSALVFTANTTLKVRAFRSGWTDSAVVTANYVIAPPVVPAPVITPASAAFLISRDIRISCRDLLAAVHYTQDGTEPTQKSPRYIDIGLPLLQIRNSVTLKAKAFRNGYSPSPTVTAKFTKAVVLFVHGLASGPGAWDQVARIELGISSSALSQLCPTLASTPANVVKADCYRAQFRSATVDGATWEAGDWENFDQLGGEVGGMIQNIINARHPALIIIVTHSRGGLAARAYLQSNARSDVKFALLTIGTPHQGSPLGRIPSFYKTDARHKLTADDYRAWQKRYDSPLRFVFSPSTETLGTDHDSSQRFLRSSISENISRLNQNVRALRNSTSAFGQIVSGGLELGQNAGPNILGVRIDLLADFGLRKIAEKRYLPGDFTTLTAMRTYIHRNLPADWRLDTDGIVPAASADLNRVPDASFTISTTRLTRAIHTEETTYTSAIRKQIDGLIETMNGRVSSWSTFSPVNSAAQMPHARRRALSMTADDLLYAAAGAPDDAAFIARDVAIERLRAGDTQMLDAVRRAVARGADTMPLVSLLAATATPVATDELLSLASRVQSHSDSAFERAVRDLGANAGDADRRGVTTRLLAELRQGDLSDGVFAAIADSVATLGREEGVSELLDLLDRDDVPMARRESVAAAMEKVSHDEAVPALAERLRADPLLVRPSARLAGDALPRIASPAATRVLLTWANETGNLTQAASWLRVRDTASIALLREAAADAGMQEDLRLLCAALADELEREYAPVD